MSVPSSVSFQTLSGDFGPVLGEVARLRLSLFREFPYLYDGTCLLYTSPSPRD